GSELPTSQKRADWLGRVFDEIVGILSCHVPSQKRAMCHPPAGGRGGGGAPSLGKKLGEFGRISVLAPDPFKDFWRCSPSSGSVAVERMKLEGSWTCWIGPRSCCVLVQRRWPAALSASTATCRASRWA